MRTLRSLAVVSAAFAWALVALSPIVRITESGMGCGDDWPLCNGRIIPPLDNPEVMIEWGHRLAAAGVSVLIGLLLGTLWLRRTVPGVRGPGGLLRPTALAAGLLVVEVLLGAVTVWLELPPTIVVLHLANAMALLAALCVTTFRAHEAATVRAPISAPRVYRSALAAAALGGLALVLGGLTANLGAGPACQGFPLCNGQLWPAGGASGLPHIHWTHRLIAYALVLHMIGLVVVTWRRGDPGRVRQAAIWVLLVLGVHVLVAALMVFQLLPLELRAAHAALGTLLWVTLVWFVWVAAPPAARPAARA